jgi:uncharacterized protein (TIGR03086 family)
LAGAITDKITQVPDACWSNPSPCPGWTARDVVRHLVETHAMFAARVGLSLEPGPAVDSDPLGAWTTASGQMQAFLDDPATAAMQFRGISRVSTLGEAVGRFICFDLSVHGWDLSRATALDERMDSREFATMWDTIHAFGDRLRSVTAFGPAVELPPGSNEQDTLLAFLGRDPR